MLYKFFRDKSLLTKSLGAIGLSVIITVAIIGVFGTTMIESAIFGQKAESTHFLVETAYSVIQAAQQKAESGEMTLEEARRWPRTDFGRSASTTTTTSLSSIATRT